MLYIICSHCLSLHLRCLFLFPLMVCFFLVSCFLLKLMPFIKLIIILMTRFLLIAVSFKWTGRCSATISYLNVFCVTNCYFCFEFMIAIVKMVSFFSYTPWESVVQGALACLCRATGYITSSKGASLLLSSRSYGAGIHAISFTLSF